jgi:iron complex outermembrane receptor protein
VSGVFNVAAFYNNFTDQQLQFGMNARVDPLTGATAPVSPTTAIINAGKSRIYGVEIDTSITPVRGLVFDLNYTYLKTEIREIAPVSTTDPNYSVSAGTIPAGTPLTLSPKNKYTVSGRYTLPLDRNIGDISVGATFIHVDSQLSNFNYLNPATVAAVGGNYGTLDSYNLLNANLGWGSIFGSSIDVNVFATNLTNKQYYTYIPGLGSTQSTLETAALGEPRMYGIRLRYRFGAE